MKHTFEAMYAIQALWSAARYEVGVLLVVFADADVGVEIEFLAGAVVFAGDFNDEIGW
jgi:hypothetical protein